MSTSRQTTRPPLRQPARVFSAAAARGLTPVAPGPAGAAPHRSFYQSLRGERRRGAIAVVAVAFVLGGLLSGYGIHRQISHAALGSEIRQKELALATAAELQTGPVLFVPQYGNVCRRRWIDNATWTLRDGGEIDCDQEAGWNSTLPVRQHKVEQRLDAISKVFQSRAMSKPE